MAGPPNNIPLRAKGYLESGIGLITTHTQTRFRVRFRIRVRVRVRVGVRVWLRLRVIVKVAVRVRLRFRVRVVIKPIPHSRYPLARKGILFGGPAMEKSLDTRRR